MKKLSKLIILCGGTGGHFFPGLSVARVFKAQGGRVSLITGKNKISFSDEFSEKYQVPIYEVQSAQIPNSPLRAVFFFFKTLTGFFQSLIIFLKEKPDAVLGMGSYTSLPSSIAAVFLRIPLFLHDGNSLVGRANSFLSRWSRALMSAFPAINTNIQNSKIILTGMPLRPELVSSAINTKSEAILKFNNLFKTKFSEDRVTILVFGGSLGAKKINEAAPAAVSMMETTKTQTIHLTGKGHFKETLERYGKTNTLYHVMERSDEMAMLYKMADIVICRSGGSTVAELDFFDKNSILIPYPLALGNHQFFNALYLKKKNSNNTILEDKDCNAETLKLEIENMIPKTAPESHCKENPALKVLSIIEEKL